VAWLNEIKKQEDQYENYKASMEGKIDDLQHENEMKKQEVQRCALSEERIKSDLKRLDSQIKYYEEHYMKKEDAERIRHELEVKYKLEMNKRLQQVSAVFEHEQEELLQTMRASIAQRRGTGGTETPIMKTTHPTSKLQTQRSPTLYSL